MYKHKLKDSPNPETARLFSFEPLIEKVLKWEINWATGYLTLQGHMEAEQWDLGIRSKKSSRFAGNKGRNGKKIGKQRILNTRRGWLALYETII